MAPSCAYTFPKTKGPYVAALSSLLFNSSYLCIECSEHEQSGVLGWGGGQGYGVGVFTSAAPTSGKGAGSVGLRLICAASLASGQ